MTVNFNVPYFIRLLENNKPLGVGSFGHVYNIDGVAFKIYNKFIMVYEDPSKLQGVLNLFSQSNEIDLLGQYNKDNMSRLDSLIQKSQLVKGAVLPNGKILISDTLVGVTMTLLDEYITLDKYIKDYEDSSIPYIMKKIKKNVNEITSYGIYPNDLKSCNIMINPLTKDIKLIDLDDQCTNVLEEKKKKHHKFIEDEVRENIKILRQELLNKKDD